MYDTRFRYCAAAMLTAALAVVPAAANAQSAAVSGTIDTRPSDDPLVTDRPDATESAETVSPGRFQIEGGYTIAGADDIRAHSLGEVLIRVGVIERLELRFGLNSYAWLRTPDGSVSGLSDTSIGLKAKLREGGSGFGDPTIAILASTTLPTGADDFSLGAAAPESRLAIAWDLSDRVGLSSNVGWAYLPDPATGERFNELAASIALGYGLGDRWGTFIEYFGFYPLESKGPDASFVDGGLTYLLTADLQLDARVGYGLSSGSDDFFFGIGTSARW